MTTTPKTTEYSADSFQHLAGPDSVRQRPTMYLGDLNNATFTCVRELCDNVVDEALAGRATLCEIILTKKHGIFVRDNGRGFPHGDATAVNAIDGSKVRMPAFQLATGMIHGGAKMGSKAYTRSRGLNGLGMTAANFMASEFEGWSINARQGHSIHYAKGKLQRYVPASKFDPESFTHPVTGKTITVGTMFRFVPDKSILPNVTIDPSALEAWAREASYFTAGLRVRVYQEGVKGVLDFYSENGIGDMAEHLREKSSANLLDTAVPFRHTSELADVALLFTDFDGCEVRAHTNGLLNVDRGVHYTAVLNAIWAAVDQLKLKRDVFTASDLHHGLVGVVDAYLEEPKFSSQTKDKLVDARAGKPLEEELIPVFLKFFRKNRALLDTLVQRCLALNSMKTKFAASKTLLRVAKAVKKQGMPAKAALSLKATPDEREVFVVEGDSAKGPAVLGRLPHQEVLPMRGKMKNAYKVSKKPGEQDAAIANEEALQLMMLVGYDPTKPDDLTKVRTKKIIFLADPDPDGPLRGDTEVDVLLEATKECVRRTLIELYGMYLDGVHFRVLAMNPVTTALQWTQVREVQKYTPKQKEKTVRFRTQSGERFESTLQHRWPIVRPKGYHERIVDASGKPLHAHAPDAFGFVHGSDLKSGDRLLRVVDKDGGVPVSALSALQPSSRVVHDLVTTVKQVAPSEEVYFCLSVTDHSNFVTASGHVTGNCHINSLLLALFCRYASPLVRAGYVYVVDAPEFYAVPQTGPSKGQTIMGASRRELSEKLAAVNAASTPMHHLKGWGESPTETFIQIALNPSTRKLRRLTFSDEGLADVSRIMGSDVESRRVLLGVE